MSQDNIVISKRKPGRPSSKTKSDQEKRNGIVVNSQYLVEMYFAVPIVLKKLYVLYKNIKAKEIIMQFKKECVIFIARSFSELTDVRTYIDCTQIHSYYCGQEICIKMSQMHSEDIINRIDTDTFNAISFMIKKANEINTMHIDLHNRTLEAVSHCHLNIEVINCVTSDEAWDTSRYKLNFTLNKSTFKKYMSDVKSISTLICIEKAYNSPLTFKYVKETGVLRCNEEFKNSKTIKENCTIKKNEIIATSADISEIVHLSNSQIAEEITTYVDSNLPLLFVIEMDKAITTKVLIAVEDYQNV